MFVIAFWWEEILLVGSPKVCAVTMTNTARRARCGVLAAVVMSVGVGSVCTVLAGPRAVADPCPDVEVVFARGTFEPAGLGVTGQAFVDALAGRLAGRSLVAYPVNYPASLDFPRAADGVQDAATRIEAVAMNCPATRIVIAGYSQGAAVAAYTTADGVPPGYRLPDGIAGPMPTSIGDHVAAVALFGKPSNRFLNLINRDAPPITIGPRYAAKTIDQCADEDPVCSADGRDQSAHGAYPYNGMTDQAADFVVQSLSVRA